MGKENFCCQCFAKLPADTSGSCPCCGYHQVSDLEKYPMALPAGTVLNKRYLTGRVLGQGGFGITYVAKDLHSRTLVAVKEYLPVSMAVRTGDNQVCGYSGRRGTGFFHGRKCFLKEAQTLAEFRRSPDIVHVHSYFEENGTAYFVMDYIKGTSLFQYVHSHGGKLDWQEAVALLLPVADALGAVHEKGMIHRDVTPDNILITEDGSARLLDFGAARYSPGDISRSLDVVLKHGFAPVEQYKRHGRQGAYTDIYTLAATIYFAVTGRIPPDSVDRLEEDRLVPPSDLGVRLPDGKEKALQKALGVRPDSRYQNVDELRQAVFAPPDRVTGRDLRKCPVVPLDTYAREETSGETDGQAPEIPGSWHDSVGNKSHPCSQDARTQKETSEETDGRNHDIRGKAYQPVRKKRRLQRYTVILTVLLLVWNKAGSSFSYDSIPVISDLRNILFYFSSNKQNKQNKQAGSVLENPADKTKNHAGKDPGGNQAPDNKFRDRSGNKTTEGNTAGNITADGMTAEDDRYCYYTTVNGLMRVSKYTGKRRILDEAYARSLNLYDGWLYYIAGGGIWKIRPDGTQRCNVVKGQRNCRSLYLADGVAYIACEKKPGTYVYTLLCADPDNWHITEGACGLAHNGYMVSGGYVYYRDSGDNCFYKVRLQKQKGSREKKKELLGDMYLSAPVKSGKWIYGYTPQNDICRIAADGSAQETVCASLPVPAISGMNLKDGRLYVCGGYQRESPGMIGSIRLDGTDYKELYAASAAGEYFHNLNVTAGRIVAAYCVGDHMTGTVSIDLDTNRQETY